NITSIGVNVFANCSSLTTIIIRRETPPTIVAKESDKSDKSLWNKEFSHTNPNIYVPKVETYKEHSDWSQYKDNIKPLSELPK
ncbi:MAG: hypothetical protein IKZ11_04315, partial [Alistipes sp.]|nr:hypothetical protein [Alistipes sp.]